MSIENHDVVVKVEVYYENELSKPHLDKYIFSYRVHIQNTSNHTVKLLSRTWNIVAGDGETKVVQGEGVVGEKPVIHPGQTYSYTSWCPLQFPLGKMYGTYDMQRLKDASIFKAEIPEFTLIADFVHN